MRVRVVGEDVRTAAAIGRGPRFERLAIDVAADGEEALRPFWAREYDAIVIAVWFVVGAAAFGRP